MLFMDDGLSMNDRENGMKKRQKGLLSALLVFTLSFGLVMNVHAVTINEAQNKADELESQKNAAENEKQSLNDQLQKIVTEMKEVQEKIDKKFVEIEAAEDELVQAKVDESTQYESMKKRIKYMYENGNTQVLEVLVESDNIGDFLNKAEYAQSLSKYDRKQLEEFQESVKKVQAEEEALKKEYKEMESLKSEMVEKQNNVQTLLNEKNIQIASLEKEIGDNAAVLKDLIQKAEEEQKRQEQLQQQQSQNNGNHGGGGFAPPTSDNVISGSGQFAHPCPGSVLTSSFGYRDFDNSFHKGIDLAAPTGTPTYAAAAGRVLYAFYSVSAGNWVVIDHGNGLVTKYMHHDYYTVTQGQYVEKGQQVGVVGNTGNSFGAHLHFQVELYGVAVDPMGYL